MTQPTGFQDGDWFEVKRLLEFLLARVVDTGGQNTGIRFGTSTVTWGGVFTNSGVTTVSHGLNKLPIIVGAWDSDSTATEFFFCSCPTSAFTTTQFGVRGHARAVPVAQTNTITWVAIG